MLKHLRQLFQEESISSTFYEQLWRRYSFAEKIQSQTEIRKKLLKAILF